MTADARMPGPIDRILQHVTDDSYNDVADAQDIPEGSSLAVEVAGHEVLICHTKGEFFAVENQCSHALSKLENGRLREVPRRSRRSGAPNQRKRH